MKTYFHCEKNEKKRREGERVGEKKNEKDSGRGKGKGWVLCFLSLWICECVMAL